MPQSPTRSGTPRLSEVAKHVVAPTAVTSTGWPAVQNKCLELGIRFRFWQPAVGRLILAKRADGKYAATIGGTGLSIPRQVGKTFLVGAIVFALCLLRPGLTVIWTANRLRTAEETFGKMQVFAKRRKIAPHVLKVVLGSGEEEIGFRNGSRILFGARERGFGRGFDEVDVLIFDEAQILSESALDDMVPATNQSRQDTGALLLFMGTPPKPTDRGDVFRRMRSEALSGEDSDTGWVEFGADEGYTPTPLPAPLTKADWTQVAKANVSYPHDTPREAILRMRKKLGQDSFLREGLGIWDDAPPQRGSFSAEAWAACAGKADTLGEGFSFGLDVALDRSRAWLGVAVARTDGLAQLELVETGVGTGWVVERLAELYKAWQSAVYLDAGGPAASLVPDIQAAGVPVEALPRAEVVQACGALFDAVNDGLVVHLDDRILTGAVLGAQLRAGESFVFTRKGNVDISPLYAVTLAYRGYSTRTANVYESRGLVTLG